jgi:meso-butanediol dehydrogenase/(S,S)-butanediol dehydrogenase/diacetyl reductase
MALTLQGKTVLVTGAARGIGASIAAHFARQGCRVVVSDVDFEGASICAEGLGGNSMAMRMDVRDREEVHTVSKRIVQELGVVINS